MKNQEPRKDTLMWKIMDEHKMLAELSPKHDLLRYCIPWHEDGMLEWTERHMDEFYDKFRQKKEKVKKNGYDIMKGFITQKKEKPMTARQVKTNYYNALRNATNNFNGIK